MCDGPGVLAFDGERTDVLRRGDRATITVRHRRWPGREVDVERVLQARGRAPAQFDMIVEEDSDAD